MLSITLRSGEYVFIFAGGQPIGAIVARSEKKAKIMLAFAGTRGGNRNDFEVMRSKVIERRFGPAELQRLIELFNL